MTAVEQYEEQIPQDEYLPPAPLPESPFSLTFRMLDGSGCEVQATIRAGVTLETVAEVMTVRKQFVEKAQQAGWTFTGAAKPAPGPATNGMPPPGPVAANVAGGGFASQPRESFVAVKMEVTPRADGRVDCKFYAAGHQYPDLYMTKTIPDTILALSKTGAWTADKFAAAQSFEPINYVVEYTLSAKLNSKGKPFKDVSDIRPA